MHWLLFIHKILFSSTYFEPQVLIFRGIQLYTCRIWYCHREWQYHMLHVYNCILLKMSTWGSKYVEENNILWINNNQCIKLVINIYPVFASAFCFIISQFQAVFRFITSVSEAILCVKTRCLRLYFILVPRCLRLYCFLPHSLRFYFL